jgi:NAD-dependent SIR2 family protein deacetylase
MDSDNFGGGAGVSSSESTLLDWLLSARRVLAFCGAGISAESGIPTFRGLGGLWEGHSLDEVATPEGFARDPGLVWRFYAARQAALPGAQPNPAHRALAAVEALYDELLVVTQNVDDLHERAGTRNLVKLHGSLLETRCCACGSIRALKEPISGAEIAAGRLPRCDCGGLERPNVVWFGELLDSAPFVRIDRFFRRCSPARASDPLALLLVIGTSGMVSAGYGLTNLARRAGARVVEINPAETELSDEMDLVVRAPAGALAARLWPALLERWNESSVSS